MKSDDKKVSLSLQNESENAVSDSPRSPRRAHDRVKRLVGMALLAALAYLVMLAIKIPVSFLTLDVKDAIITLAAFLYGPLAGPILALLVAGLEAVTVSTTGIYGFIMNFTGSAIFSLVASAIFCKTRRHRAAFAGLYAAIPIYAGVMLLMNLWITPLYTGAPREAVVGMLLPLLLPFNLAKSALNAAAVLLLYQPVLLAAVRSHAVGHISFDLQKPARREWIFFAAAVAVSAAIAVVALLIANAYAV